jgi:hypothetical protein
MNSSKLEADAKRVVSADSLTDHLHCHHDQLFHQRADPLYSLLSQKRTALFNPYFHDVHNLVNMSGSRSASRSPNSHAQSVSRRSSKASLRSRSASSASSTSILSVSPIVSSTLQGDPASTAEIVKGLGPLVILIRHFEAECNLTDAKGEPRHDVIDAPLTTRGLLQAKKIPDVYPNLWKSIESIKGSRIWTSPMTRAVQTTLFGLPKVAGRKSMVKVLPDL